MYISKKQIEENFLALQQVIEARKQFEEENLTPDFRYKTDINYYDVNCNTLLHYAAALGDLSKVKDYNKQFTDFDKKNLEGKTPFELALEYGNIEVAQYLYKKGASCSGLKLSEIKNTKSREWMHQMMQNTVSKYTEKLISIKDTKIRKLKKSFYDNNNFIENFDPDKDSHFKILLDLATQANDFNAIQKLIKKRADVFSRDSDSDSESDTNLNKSDIDVFSSLLITAAQMHNEKLCNFFIKKGANINKKSHFSADTPLHAAVRSNNVSMVHYFLQHNANKNYQTQEKITPLMQAVSLNNIDTTKALLEAHADYTLADVNGDTIIHYAAQYAGPEMMQFLLNYKQIKSNISTENIYGYTPLDIAIQHKNDSAILLLQPNISLAEIKNLPNYGHIPVKISQTVILEKINYYFKSQRRSRKLFSPEGHCSGFQRLFHYYASRNMLEYYFSTLKLIASWDGTQKALDREFDENMPQKKYYKNLGQLIEQWSNDIIWFQHIKAADISKISHLDTKKQFDFIGFSSSSASIGRYTQLYYNLDLRINKEQLNELLQYVTRMPKGVHFNFLGDEHATGNYIQDENLNFYFDPNFQYKPKAVKDNEKLLQRIIDYKYILIEKYKNEFNPEFEIFCFEHELSLLNFSTFKVFSDKEMPISQEEANLFKKNSPNGFTHLHIAIMTQSVPCVKKLLEDGFCDIKAIDCHKKPAWKSALESHNKDIVEIFLEKAIHLVPKKEIGNHIAYLYKNNYYDFLDVFIERLDFSYLEDIFCETIFKKDLFLCKKIIEKHPEIINQHLSEGITATHLALLNGSLEIFIELLNQGENIHIKSLTALNKSVSQIVSEYPCSIYVPGKEGIDPFKFAILERLDVANSNDRQVLFDFLRNELRVSNDTFFKQLLIKCSVDVTLLEGKGLENNANGLLNLAFIHANPSKFILLLNAGCDPNNKNNFGIGDEPLLVSCLKYLKFEKSSEEREKYYQYIDALLSHGADMNLCNKSGISAINLVNDSEDERIRQIFTNHSPLGNQYR